MTKCADCIPELRKCFRRTGSGFGGNAEVSLCCVVLPEKVPIATTQHGRVGVGSVSRPRAVRSRSSPVTEVSPEAYCLNAQVMSEARCDVAVYVRLSQNWLIASVVPFLVTGGDNPYEGKKNVLTEKQVAKRRRMIRHIKRKGG